ncbi:hypothetical protein G6N74_05360 [Mesorhizobium sp. CGMCC 1.15528]|uniref:Uncharacterized protein n=1 Tax=Mesorhizobium zhangyense TaxID=1776730 RepID=A0A7C9V4K0_9HYPH|nr:hypothetical protein [Mesorhizobium zhangyense]NGN40485.1 hypothetical protein [Mesorhizobium zhangyense]
MKKLLLGSVACLAVLSAPANAQMRHDVKLEQAVMEIVARKIGDIRGGFSYERKPEFVVLNESYSYTPTFLESARAELIRRFDEGLLPLTERTVSRVITF